MSWLWPGFLVLLALVPLLIAAYLWVLRRQRVGLRHSSLSLVRVALPRYSQWRRHVPFALFLVALCGLVVALARPINIVPVPTGQATIMLVLDVSGSMRQRDILPSRLGAAQEAALQFIQNQKPGTQIGVVAFAGYAQLIQSPTTDKDALRSAIESLSLGRGTNLGAGILQGLDAIAEIDPSVAPAVDDPSSGGQPAPVPKGAYAPDIMVLLTDGVPTTGPQPVDAAQQAADRGIKIYTVGFGTAQGSPDFGFGGGGGFGRDPGSFPQGGGGVQGGGGPLYGGGGYGRGFRRGLDEEMLQQIASITGADYHSASSADELEKVFAGLPTYLITKHEVMELSVFFAGAGAILLVLALFFSQRWHPLP